MVKTKKERIHRDYQEELTLKFILRIEEALVDSEKGLKWQKPFFTCEELPRNALTGDKYSGCNIVSLLSEDWTDPRWMTFMQIGELGRKLGKKLYVAGGQRASFVMKTIPVYQKDEDGEVIKDSKGKPIPVNNKDGSPKIAFKWYAVFNAGQIAGGLDPYIKSERVVKPNEAVDEWRCAVSGWGLLDARTEKIINPVALVTNEKIEMTDWELQDFAVQVVRDDLEKSGKKLMSWQGNPAVDPSIWFIGDIREKVQWRERQWKSANEKGPIDFAQEVLANILPFPFQDTHLNDRELSEQLELKDSASASKFRAVCVCFTLFLIKRALREALHMKFGALFDSTEAFTKLALEADEFAAMVIAHQLQRADLPSYIDSEYVLRWDRRYHEAAGDLTVNNLRQATLNTALLHATFTYQAEKAVVVSDALMLSVFGRIYDAYVQELRNMLGVHCLH